MNTILTCNIDDYLRANRMNKRYSHTVRGLEKAVGMSHQGLLNIRSGMSEPKLGTAVRIAMALGTTVEEVWPSEQFHGAR